MNVQIKHRWTGAVLYECDVPDSVESDMRIRYALEKATSEDANLTDAVLTRADLTDAVLTRADLTRAVLTGANLTDADLTGAVLTRANLTDAVLTRADLTGADLTGAVLTDADLTGAVLTDAVLTRADLTGADLTGAVLDEEQLRLFRDDIWAVLSSAPHEANAVLAALQSGRVDGSTYEGECACLVGTIAKTRKCDYDQLQGLSPNSGRYAEQWFMQIKPGQTPENHKPCALAAQWVSEWIKNMRAAFGRKVSA